MSECNIEILAKNLRANNIEFLSFATKQEVLAYLKSNLQREQKIAWGGSMTLRECGILDYLRTEKFPHLLDRDDPKLSPNEKTAIQKNTFFADVFLTSANAITEDGLIVNIDGTGNRVAATIYGPEKIYFVVGKNKLTKNYDAAIARIKNHTAPLNARRLNLPTPCVRDLKCHDCNSAKRICNYTVTIKRDMRPNRTTVLLVNEDMGL